MELNYLEVEPMNDSRLTNAEFIRFAARFIELVEQMQGKDDEDGDDDKGDGPAVQSAETLSDGVPALYISQEMIDKAKEDIDKMREWTLESRAKASTKELTECDEARDRLANYILKLVANASSLPDEEDRKAGELLNTALKVYSGVAKLPQNQETETIKGMLIDIRKEEYAAAVEAFGIKKYADRLEEENLRFEQLAGERSKSYAETRSLEKNKEIRSELEQILNAMADYAFAANLLHGTDETADFINNLNAHIAETKMYYNRRSSSRNKTEEDDGGTDGGDVSEEPDDKPVVS